MSSPMSPDTYHCPVEVAMDVIGGKWTAVVLAHLKQQPQRYSELRRLTPRMSEKMLTQRLRELEAAGVVGREVVSTSPRHVVYDLTADGRSLAPVLQAMYDWGTDWADQHDLDVITPHAG